VQAPSGEGHAHRVESSSAAMNTLSYPDVPLHEVMRATARRFPTRIALRHRGRTISFDSFDRESNRLAHGLVSLGVMAGDRVGLYLPNCPEFALGFYAASKAGAIACPVNPSYREFELTRQLDDLGVTVLLTSESQLLVVSAARTRWKTVREVIVVGDTAHDGGDGLRSYTSVVADAPDAPLPFDVSPDDLVALPYSSGTTGLPKGVMLTHRNLVSNHIQFGTGCRLGPDDRFLVYLPLSHIYGVALMGLAMWSGAEQVLLERFDLTTLARLVDQHQVTWLHVVPPVLLALAESPDVDPVQFRSVKYALSAAAPLAPDVARRVTERFGFPVIQAYGLTETSPATHLSPLDLGLIKIGSGGVPVADTEQRVVDVETGTRVLAAGEIGEIAVRGRQVMRGYWNAPEETARVIRDGWLYTGDIGWVDDEAYVFIVDRKKEMIKYKSFSIAPAELEAALLEHPDVADCAVTAVPDREAGEVPKAFVVCRTGTTIDLDQLGRFMAERVAGYKQIRQWAVVASIPRTPSGKILRRHLP
jgi:long-chain acyl-CoA synthetase